jgi:hypothetical protein
MLALDTNPDHFKPTQASAMDDTLAVKFFHKPKQDMTASAKEGRPIFNEVEYIDIRVAGKAHSQACRPATFADKQRFPRHYEAFQKRVEMPEEGTPLTEWPQISRSQAEELTFMNIKTVEQLIACSDTNITKMFGGMNLRRQAEDWLSLADATKLAADKVELEARIASLEALVAKHSASAKQAAEDVPHETFVDELKDDILVAPPAVPARRRRAAAKK